MMELPEQGYAGACGTVEAEADVSSSSWTSKATIRASSF
jgi:hypothetical protein